MRARKSPLWLALLVVGLSSAVLSVGLIAGGGDIPVPVLLSIACGIPAVAGRALGHPWSHLEEGLVEGMRLALQALTILLIVGATIAAWSACGTLAAMVDLGLATLVPAVFLPATLFVCAAVSLAIGSSWATAATVGVALMGVGDAMGFSAPMTAGAVLSGSYFGDKMSPLSDTTNLAPGIAGAELFEHIQAMFATTFPAFGLATVGFVLLGLVSGGAGGFDPASIDALRASLASVQHLSIVLVLPPLVVITLALLRVPALPALAAGTLIGGLLAVGWQGMPLKELLTALYSGHSVESGSAAVDKLLSRGGMSSMLDTIALILTATAFGGLLERAGFVSVLLEALMKRVHGPRGLIITTVFASVGVNVLIAEQYLAIVLPGRMFQSAYTEQGLHPTMLSRTLEDAGTVTSPLVPWNSCGAYMAATLGVSTFAYLPFAFFNLLMPVIAITWAGLGWFIRKTEPGEGPRATPHASEVP